MYQSFSIVAITPNYFENNISIITNFDVDPATVDEKAIQLYSKSEKVDVVLDFIVDGTEIKAIIKDDINLNTSYILRISGLKTVIGEDLSSGIRRTITFETKIKEVPTITSPVNFEELTDLKVTLKASLEDMELANKAYFIQIAKDVAFINLVLETETMSSTVNLKDLIADQYYIRARIQGDNNEFGNWSETVTFTSTNSIVDETVPNEDLTPEIIEEIELMEIPANGETPSSLILKFSGEINIDSIGSISVIRRDV